MERCKSLPNSPGTGWRSSSISHKGNSRTPWAPTAFTMMHRPRSRPTKCSPCCSKELRPGSLSAARAVWIEQRPKHDHGILIGSLVLPYRPGNHAEFYEAQPFPETAREHIF